MLRQTIYFTEGPTHGQRNKQLQSGKGCAFVRGCGHKSWPEKEEVDVEIPMQRMSKSSQKQPRRHLVCYMWKLVTR